MWAHARAVRAADKRGAARANAKATTATATATAAPGADRSARNALLAAKEAGTAEASKSAAAAKLPRDTTERGASRSKAAAKLANQHISGRTARYRNHSASGHWRLPVPPWYLFLLLILKAGSTSRVLQRAMRAASAQQTGQRPCTANNTNMYLGIHLLLYAWYICHRLDRQKQMPTLK